VCEFARSEDPVAWPAAQSLTVANEGYFPFGNVKHLSFTMVSVVWRSKPWGHVPVLHQAECTVGAFASGADDGWVTQEA